MLTFWWVPHGRTRIVLGAVMTTAVTITGRVAELHATMAAQPPNEVMGAFRREQAGLAAVGPPDGIAPVGMVVADVDLLDTHGAPTSLYAATGDAASVAVFYRGAWYLYCNIALATYQAQLLPQLTERGVRLLAISPQTPDGSLSMQEKNELAFGVLSDPGNVLAGSASSPGRPTRPAPPNCNWASTSPGSTPTPPSLSRCRPR
jgi:hypothetical protein